MTISFFPVGGEEEECSEPVSHAVVCATESGASLTMHRRMTQVLLSWILGFSLVSSAPCSGPHCLYIHSLLLCLPTSQHLHSLGLRAFPWG